MDELEAQSQPPLTDELQQAETEPQAAEPSFDEIVAPELIGALPELPAFTEDELAEQVAASNIKVIWRGGIPARALFAVAVSLAINCALALAAYYLVMYGFWTGPKPTQREFGAYVTLPVDIEDGGSAGGIGAKGDAKAVSEVKGPSLDNLINGKPTSDLLGPVDRTDSDAFTSAEAGEKLSLIASGTGATPRMPGKSKGGGGGGTGNSSGAGLGGTGSGSGTGNGDGADLGLSLDTQVRILDGPKLNIPMAYLTGTVKVNNPPLIRVWVKPNNRVDRVELVKSSGDATFDDIVMEHYRRQKYLAATVDGEPVEKFIEVSYELASMRDKS